METKLTIELVYGKWHVNGNPFDYMSETEKAVLSTFISEYNKELELKIRTKRR